MIKGDWYDIAVTVEETGMANTIVQWIRLRLDQSVTENAIYEVKPEPGRESCWVAMSWPLASPLALTAGQNRRIAGQRTDNNLMIWLAD
jgi:hypothetical protein